MGISRPYTIQTSDFKPKTSDVVEVVRTLAADGLLRKTDIKAIQQKDEVAVTFINEVMWYEKARLKSLSISIGACVGGLISLKVPQLRPYLLVPGIIVAGLGFCADEILRHGEEKVSAIFEILKD